MVGVLGLSGCGGGGGSSSTGGTLPQTSIAPTATLDGWTPNDSTLLQYKTYTFAASATDPNIGGSITEFRWDFGDGTTRTTPVVLSGGKATTTATYSYVASGTPTLSVVAKNAAGLLSTAATKSLTVGTSPSPLTVSFTSPTAATLINAVLGNSVTLTYKVNVVYTGFGTVSASGVTLDPGEATATKATPVDAGGGNYTIAVTYAAATAMGSRTVTPSVKVVDSNGVSSTTVLGPAITIKTVSATNTAPIISLTAASTPAAGTNATWQNVDVVFTAIASDPDEDPLSYTWDLGDGTVITGTTELTQTHKYSRPGLYSVKVTANDGRTGGTKTADLTLNVLVNRAPTVVVTKALPTGNPTKYQRVTLNAAVTDLDSDLPTVTWNFGDGTPPETGTPVVHQFKAAGVSTIVATVDDGKGGSGSSTLLLTVVENNPPVAAVTTASAELFQNKVYTFTATASDIDTADTIASYEWDFGNGVVVAGGASQTHVFPVTVTGAVAVRARAIDSRGAVGDWSPAVSFTVVATQFPVVTVVSPASAVSLNTEVGAAVAKQRLVTFVVRVTNPNGAAGVYLPLASVAFSANDALATVVSSTNNLDGTYSYVVRYAPAAAQDDPAGRTSSASVAGVTDGVGVTGQGVSAPMVTIVTQASNQTPVATLVSAPAVAAGTNATWQNVNVVFTGTATDADSDPLTYTWDFGDGTVLTNLTGASALVQTHKFTSAGNYSVKLTVDDSRTSGTKIADLTMNVLVNRAPQVVVTKTLPSGNPTKYQRVTLNAAVTDLDGDVPTLTWNFGDGSVPVIGTATMVHQFLAAGLTNVTVTADDAKGGVTVGTLQLTVVENNPPVAAVTTVTASLYQNKSYTFTATASDPDGDAIASYEWDFGNDAVVAGGASQTHVFPVTVTGAVAVRARAIDSRGAVGDWSPAVSFTVVATQFPVVTVVS
ncbi:MAG: PKD domain-containing protein, partial [Holophagaceae bacterium]